MDDDSHRARYRIDSSSDISWVIPLPKVLGEIFVPGAGIGVSRAADQRQAYAKHDRMRGYFISEPVMQTLHVARDFEVDAATVFDVIADHAGYASLPGVLSAWVRKPGDHEPNGVGAERVLKLPAMTLVERITEYEPGASLGYQIIESPLPMHHLGGRILLQPLGTKGVRTRVHWTSRLRGTTPIAAELAATVIGKQMSLAYRLALATWARRLR